MNAKNELIKEINELLGYDVELEEILKKFVIRKEKKYNKISIHTRIEQFIVAKQIDNLSQKTIDNYKLTLNIFANHIRKTVNTINTDDIRDYIVYLSHERRIKQSSLDTYLACIKSFFNWLQSEEIINKNPTLKIKSGKFDKISTRKSLKIEEILLIKDSCKNIREKSIIEFLLSTGCRLSEVINLNIEDIDFIEQSIKVLGKGKKQRIVYFSTEAKIYLTQYLQQRKGNSDAIFTSIKKPYERLNQRALQKIVRNIGVKAGLKNNIHPHLFRHTFATTLLNKGMDIVIIQRLLGHSNLQTTQIYAKLDTDRIKYEYKKFIK